MAEGSLLRLAVQLQPHSPPGNKCKTRQISRPQPRPADAGSRAGAFHLSVKGPSGVLTCSKCDNDPLDTGTDHLAEAQPHPLTVRLNFEFRP